MRVFKLEPHVVIFYISIILLSCYGKVESEIELPDSARWTYSDVAESYFQKYESLRPENGLVPDAQTAIKIAEAIWHPIWGDKIYTYRPYEAKLVRDTFWRVYASRKVNDSVYRVISTPVAEIRRSDGKIQRVFFMPE